MPFYTILEANKHHTPEWGGDADFCMELAWWDYAFMLEKYPFKMAICSGLHFYLFVTPASFIDLANCQLSRNNSIDKSGHDIDRLLDFVSDIQSYQKIRIVIYFVEAE